MNTTLQKIIDAKDTGEKKITVEEWGVELLIIEPVRKEVLKLRQRYTDDEVPDTEGLDEKEAAEKIAASMDVQKAEDFGFACVAMMVHDLDRQLVFESMEQAREVLDEKSSLVQTQLMRECTSLISPPSVEKVKAAEGNSETTQS